MRHASIDSAGLEHPVANSVERRDDGGIALDAMTGSASVASQFLRCIANPHRLMVLCHLTHGEASVGQLERELGIRQAHLSQQLARLRQDGLVTTRRDSRTIYYALASDAAREIVALVYRLFCTPTLSSLGND